ncbi:hypothetical protein, partial [Streptomyces sp. ISL-94]|uniref:hypothetical protein n=1 Tax=Streptomyces sp. ISL-94 TaxID=2819190 RepID=UPI002036251E
MTPEIERLAGAVLCAAWIATLAGVPVVIADADCVVRALQDRSSQNRWKKTAGQRPAHCHWKSVRYGRGVRNRDAGCNALRPTGKW